MAKKAKAPAEAQEEATTGVLNLGSVLSTKPTWQQFEIWIVGNTPLITHAWSQKAKLEMLQKQVKATSSGKTARNPEQDFVDSLYDMGETKQGVKIYGFPVTGIKKGIVSVAHKDKGIAKTDVMSALFLDCIMVSTRPALASAHCNMPLVRIYGGAPIMREDMVRVGVGLQKTASLAYRGEFTYWAIRLTGRYNPTMITAHALTVLFGEAGDARGLGEWRNEKSGVFGSYHLADLKEQQEWERYAAGKGPLPIRRDEIVTEAAE